MTAQPIEPKSGWKNHMEGVQVMGQLRQIMKRNDSGNETILSPKNLPSYSKKTQNVTLVVARFFPLLIIGLSISGQRSLGASNGDMIRAGVLPTNQTTNMGAW